MTTGPQKSRRSRIATLAIVAIWSLGACTQIPELDEAVPDWVRKADYPELTALDASVTTKTMPQDDSEKIAQEMSGRRDRLNNKAKRLNTPVVDTASQQRMNKGITR